MHVMTGIALESVSKRFGDTTVLDSISIEFPDGATTALVGPSGCGKSTLLKLCNALERPDSGRVLLFDEPLDYGHMVTLRRRLGYAVQGNGLFPHLTARENIALLAEVEGWEQPAIDSRLEELLALCHLEEDLVDRYPHQLSGGQQQRVGLCRAMMLRPEVLLLDEPFAAIDPITRLDIHEQMLELQRAEPRTTLLVTHDMREALRLGDRLVVLGAGRILLDAPAADVAESLAGDDPDRFLASLLAESAA
jgi:osmoprotectant transport system ATP-binding protein